MVGKHNGKSGGAVVDFREEGVVQTENCAVFARNVCKRYSSYGPPILQNFGMRVPTGTIYGLLGSSGCGKTTVLSCVVGLLQWDAGRLLVFGKEPCTQANRMPGRTVGYMPQDLALYDQLTVKEVCQFYGSIYNMSSKEIDERWIFLRDLLELPTHFKQIQHLSGGQKRRASLALALIHSPDLLCLDEPTVGLDPLLRERIWAHLHTLVDTLGTTIIITTHYIEEARLSNTVGIMRNGHLLVEDSPETLLERYNCTRLEQVVLQLCRKDDNRVPDVVDKSFPNRAVTSWLSSTVISSSVPVTNEEYDEMRGKFRLFDTSHYTNETTGHSDDNNKEAGIFSKMQNSGLFRTCRRIQGYTVVLFLIMLRHLGLFTVILFVPSFHCSLTMLAVGSEPRGMELGVVNHEIPNWMTECEMPQHFTNSCELTAFSCKYLNLLRSRVTLIPAKDENDALSQVHQGKTWGYLVIPNNYTQHGIDRAVAGNFALNATLEGFRITARLDCSQFIGSSFISIHLTTSFQEYLRQLVRSCDLGENLAELPIHYGPPVHGKEHGGLMEYILAGITVCSLYSTTMSVAALVLISDRKQGTLSRARAAGLKTVDVYAAYLITQAAVSVTQIIIWQILVHFFFRITIVGPFWLWLAFLLLCGVSGAMLGIFLGIACKDEVEALIVGVFLVPIFIMFGSAMFPTEAMTPVALFLGRLLPTHLPIVSLRSVVLRGMGLMHPSVWPGVFCLLAWGVISLLGSEIMFRKYIK